MPARLPPLLLAPDNFTAPTRTPWGGRRILRLKQGLALAEDKRAYNVVGESWELSVGNGLPSWLEDKSATLEAVIRQNPVGMLGAEKARRYGTTPLLVKLLDAAENLSLQVHPGDDDSNLETGQSGKPEAWYVVEAEPGAGVYVGWVDGTQAEPLEAALRAGQDVSSQLNFVPVQAGDFLAIEPGTPHAVGQGVLLVEPQRVLPGRHGVTYRYWDWNRLYDAEGLRTAAPKHGKPRALHLSRALEVTDWVRGCGQGAASGMRRFGSPNVMGTPQAIRLSADGAVLGACMVAGSGSLELDELDELRALTVLEGSIELNAETGPMKIRQGQTAALPACSGPLNALLERAHALLSWVTPNA